MVDRGGMVGRYLHERIAAREFAPTTARTAGYVLRDFARACPDDMDKTTRRHVLRWLGSQEGCATSTVASRYGTVKAFLRWASATGEMIKDPSHGIAGPTRPRRMPRAIDAIDVAAILATAPDARTRLAISLMVCEGLRLNEVCTLQLGDIDWRNEVITVIGKGDKQRQVHLSPATATAARTYLNEWPTAAGRLLRSLQDGISPVGPSRIGRVVTAHLAEQGLKAFPRDGVSPHAFRHSYGSDLVDAGLTMPQVADLMGHASIETTMRYQRRVDLGNTREVANARSYASGLAAVAAPSDEAPKCRRHREPARQASVPDCFKYGQPGCVCAGAA